MAADAGWKHAAPDLARLAVTALRRDANALLPRALTGADLCGADLTGVIFLVQAQIDSARGDRTTRLPRTIHRPGHWLRSTPSARRTAASVPGPPRSHRDRRGRT